MKKKSIVTICLGLSSLLGGNALATEPTTAVASGVAQDTETLRVALRDSILEQISGAQIPERQLNITSFGAKGDGKKDCFTAFTKAIRKATKQGGARIVVPAGTYYIQGPITLADNVCLDVQEGATLKFAPEAQYYPMVNTSWEGTFLYNYSPMIYGYGLKNVSIIGKGTIDGNCMTTFATWRKDQNADRQLSRDMNHQEVPVADRRFGEGHILRPQLIQLYNCSNVTLEGVKITNSPFWCIHLLKSENIICRAIRYDAKLANNDGIDPECSKNILIEDIHFDNGDDNVAIKSGRDNDGWQVATPSENIVIRNCHFKGLHAVVIGSEMSAGVRNVIVENCDFDGYCKRGIFVKTNPDRGGFVSNLFVKNCTFGDVEDLFYVTSQYAGEGLTNHHFSTVENIFVDGLKCRKASAAAVVVQGTAQKPVRNVELKNIEVEEAKIGLSIDHAIDVRMSDCHIGGRVGVPSQITAKDNLFGRDEKK
ncbi:MAG: glycoside hydrolase family 28 protein [Bacteroides sp.]|nr:glycoside hydrolase family 28 protein [Bacteroides sp.]